jgi:hypothetical protein
MYASIQRTISQAIGVSPANAEASFGSFIAAIENHDTEVALASDRGKESGGRELIEHRPTTPESKIKYNMDDEENWIKKPKVDEGEFPWVKVNEFS